MKKNILLISLAMLISCGQNSSSVSNTKISILTPDGTPTLALAEFYSDHKDDYSVFDIKGGSDPLLSAFTTQSYDVIVAPTSLGAKMYSANQNYVLYETIVWGNLYLASKSEITSLNDLENKSVTLFSKNSTPDIVLRALIEENGIEGVTYNYVDDVAASNAALLAGQAEIIVSAQPSLTSLSEKHQLYTIDLQKEWGKITSSSSYPQASIFVKKSLGKTIDNTLKKLVNAVNYAKNNPAETALKAIDMSPSFEKLGASILEKAIPLCNYDINPSQKDAIEFYLNKMDSLGLSAAFGGKLPENEFYYK